MTDILTERQRFWSEHLRRARESGRTLKAYATAHALSVQSLYAASRRERKDRGATRSRAREAFVAVALAPPPGVRLTHPSGVVLELDRLPDPGWLAALLATGARDA
jgi:hypothetical protein